MNKQEAIEEINNLKGLNILDNTINFDSEMVSKKDVLNIVKQLDEPVRPPEPQPLEIEKPVVPQFVADYINSERKPLQEIMNTALKHANSNDPAIEDWQYVHAIAYDALRGLNKEV